MNDNPISVTYCINHPEVETTLRCNRCERPICARCAVLTPTGYRCKDCVHGQQKTFDTTEWYDYPLTFLVVAVLSFIGSLIVPSLGFFTIFLAPVVGVIIAEITRVVIRRRRSMRLYKWAAASAIIGSIPNLLLLLANMLLSGSFGALLPLVWQGLYVFTIVSTIYYRLAGIQIR